MPDPTASTVDELYVWVFRAYLTLLQEPDVDVVTAPPLHILAAGADLAGASVHQRFWCGLIDEAEHAARCDCVGAEVARWEVHG